MTKWFIEKDNKIPLYLQLKDLIKYYISTGVIKDHQQLPGVNELARKLDINFDTVRKAYKELEKEGLVSMKRGTGTFVNLRDVSLPEISNESRPELDPMESARLLVRRLLRQGKTLAEVKKLLAQVISEVSRDAGRQYLIFTECNRLQVDEISAILKEQLNLKVRPVLLSELESALFSLEKSEGDLLGIVTTGFHVNEVQSVLGDRPIAVHMLVTNMSPDTRHSLDEYRDGARFGFICRDQKSVPFYTDLLRAELGGDIDLRCSVLSDRARVRSILESVDVLLVTPPVYDEVRAMVTPDKPVFNVFDRVDPMSLKMLKDNVFRKPRG